MWESIGKVSETLELEELEELKVIVCGKLFGLDGVTWSARGS